MGVELTPRLPQDANSVKRIIGTFEGLLRPKLRCTVVLVQVCTKLRHTHTHTYTGFVSFCFFKLSQFP